MFWLNRRLAVAIAIATVTLVIRPSMAGANIGGVRPDPTPTPTAGESDGSPVAIVALDGSGGVLASVHHAGPGRSGRWTCHYLAGSGTAEGATAAGAAIVTPQAGQTVDLHCTDDAGAVVHDEVLVFDPADPLPHLDEPAQAAAQALARLDLPSPAVATNPSTGTAQLVGLPTWLWLTDWATRQASATLDGVTSTVTAVPIRTTWTSSPEDQTLTCPGPGTPYRTDRPVDAQSTDCSILFEDAGTHHLTATVTYTVTWSATTGDNGPLDPITRTTTVAVAVDQAQALIR
jgi:hypothetical protein